MGNQGKNSEPATTLLVELLKAVIKQAVVESVAELSDQVKLRSPRPFSIQEASEYLSIPVGTIYQLTSSKKIPCHKKGRRLYFYQDELDAWIKEGRAKS
jgi:excisionase family DNA binding protein